MGMFSRASYWRNVSPRGAIGDFVTVWRENPYRWRVLAVSIVLSGTMLYGFVPDSQRAPPERPEVTFISTFDPTRTDAEIVASNIANQKLKERDEAERLARAERRKERARALARATFLDPDELERQYGDKPAAKPREPSPAN
jgi:hypothetical protein